MDEVALEVLLEQAFQQPALRYEFLQQLLNADIYFLGQHSIAQEIDKQTPQILSEGSQVQIKSWHKADGTEVLPFFTSLEKLKKAIQTEESYLKMHAQSFFELTLGANLVLNPNSEVSKEFVPQEIAGLLQGDFGVKPEVYEYQKDTQVQLSQPSPYPIFMVEEVKKILNQYEQIKAAYLVQMQDLTREPEISLVIGLLSDQRLNEDEKLRINRHVEQVALQCLKEKKPIDLMFLDSQAEQGLSIYLLHKTQPFYLRSLNEKKGFFAKLFS